MRKLADYMVIVCIHPWIYHVNYKYSLIGIHQKWASAEALEALFGVIGYYFIRSEANMT